MTGEYALVVTGKSKLAQMCKLALERSGFQVQLETTGARAQVQLAFTNPNLVVLDLNLPDMHGEIILRQLSSHQRFSETQLILLVDESIPAPENCSPDRVLAKPFAAPDLATLAAQVCGMSA